MVILVQFWDEETARSSQQLQGRRIRSLACSYGYILDSRDMNMKNYRPVSNLSFVSKLVERVEARQLVDYLTANHLVPSSSQHTGGAILQNQPC